MAAQHGDPTDDVVRRLAQCYDPFDPELTGTRTFQLYARLLEHRDLIWADTHGGFAVATKYDDVLAAERCPEVFSNADGIHLFKHDHVGSIPLEYDAPIHAEYRRPFLEALHRKVVEDKEPFIRAEAEALFERLCRRGGGDVMTEVALPITFNVMAEMMGASASFRRQGPELFETFVVNMANESGVRAQAAIKELLGAEAQHVAGGGGDGFIRILGETRVEGGRPLTEEEVVNALLTFSVAGYETTMSLMGSITVLMGRDPELQEQMRTDNSLIPAALEEALRLYPPGHSVCRTVKTKTNLGGRDLAPGDKVMLILAAANRDERRFDHAGEFDLKRANVRQHLSFGFGAHLCAGNHLARAESRVYAETLLNRCPPYVLGDGVDFGPLRAGHLLNWERVPVEFTTGG